MKGMVLTIGAVAVVAVSLTFGLWTAHSFRRKLAKETGTASGWEAEPVLFRFPSRPRSE